MRFGAAITALSTLQAALDDLIPRSLAGLEGEKPDLAVLHVTHHFESELEPLVAAVRERTRADVLIGCTAEGVIGPGTEIERSAGVSLWVASLPGARVRGLYIHPSDLENVESQTELERVMRVKSTDEPSFLLLADPVFTPYVMGLLEAIGKVYPKRPVFGGMASGADGPGQSALFLDDDVFREGAVAVALWGDVEIRPIVSQGCRPVGKPFIITAAERNKIVSLGGRPALSVLTEVFRAAPEQDQKLMSNGIFIGRAIDEYRDEFQRGDFLIRNVIGADKEDEAIYMADLARVGTTVQFHVRDADSADEDLRSLLTREAGGTAGGLMFSCNGRGTRMFPEAHHDAGAFRSALGDLPVAGFFCAGEIGPVAGQNFIHGHTASIALFKPRHSL